MPSIKIAGSLFPIQLLIEITGSVYLVRPCHFAMERKKACGSEVPMDFIARIPITSCSDHLPINPGNKSHCLSQIIAAYADPVDITGNTLLVSTWSCGAFKVDVKQRTSTPFPSWMMKATGTGGYFKAFHRDRKGNLWATSSRNGLLFFDEKEMAVKSYFPPADQGLEKPRSLGTMLEDPSGNFWLEAFTDYIISTRTD